MTCLARLQSDFHAHLLDRPSDIKGQIVAGGVTVEHRLNIYHNAYRVRLLDNLKDAFEKTWTYMGDLQFEAAAFKFIEEHPPLERNLRWHGKEFPAWLASYHPLDPEIAELAFIDWQLRRAFDGPDAKPLIAEELARLAPADWETVGFRFVPTLALGALRTNSVSIWRALDEDQAPPLSAELAEQQWLLIWRREWQPHFRSVDAVEYFALSQLIQGTSFAALCEALDEQWPDRDCTALAGQYLATWLADALLMEVAR